ncbi:MAG: hypothetical protein OEX77_11500 [Candidatus Bathyarchaeota archaeon]|nr:hypothetical protein [Candidatus Bathyarchaeota archaeon]
MNPNSVKRIIDWTLYAVTIVYLLTGLGITQYRITERLTFGLLSKSFSLNIHENLLVPFLALLSIHLLFRPIIQIYSAVRKDRAGLTNNIL